MVEDSKQRHVRQCTFLESGDGTAECVIQVSSAPLQIVIDPSMKVLMTVDFNPGTEMLKRTLTDRASVTATSLEEERAGFAARVWAAKQLLADTCIATSPALQHVTEAMKTEPFWGVRVEVAKSLGALKLPHAISALAAMLTSEQHPRAMASIASACGVQRPVLRQALRAFLSRGRENLPYRAHAAALHALGQQQNISRGDEDGSESKNDNRSSDSGKDEEKGEEEVRGKSDFEILCDALKIHTYQGIVQCGALRGLAALTHARITACRDTKAGTIIQATTGDGQTSAESVGAAVVEILASALANPLALFASSAEAETYAKEGSVTARSMRRAACEALSIVGQSYTSGNVHQRIELMLREVICVDVDVRLVKQAAVALCQIANADSSVAAVKVAKLHLPAQDWPWLEGWVKRMNSNISKSSSTDTVTKLQTELDEIKFQLKEMKKDAKESKDGDAAKVSSSLSSSSSSSHASRVSSKSTKLAQKSKKSSAESDGTWAWTRIHGLAAVAVTAAVTLACVLIAGGVAGRSERTSSSKKK